MRKIRLFLIIAFGAIVSYYLVEVGIAFKDTPGLKNRFLTGAEINLTVEELSPRQMEILIKVQDPNFHNHKGVEFSEPGSGWTTITQSLAKRFYFNPFKQGIRKIKQILLARFVLHYQLSKEEQLLIFINYVWFEKGVTGFRDAALHFYSKDITQLNEDEFIALMAMPVNPKRYNINIHPDNNADRSLKIKKMLRGEYQPKGLFDVYYDK